MKFVFGVLNRNKFIDVKELHYGIRKIDTDLIIYIETYNRNIIIHCTDKDIICSNGIKELYSQLNKNKFYMPHRSYIINFGYIKEIRRTMILLTSSENIILSRRKFSDIREKYNTWCYKNGH